MIVLGKNIPFSDVRDVWVSLSKKSGFYRSDLRHLFIKMHREIEMRALERMCDEFIEYLKRRSFIEFRENHWVITFAGKYDTASAWRKFVMCLTGK